jgi:hypothetical protein
MSTREGLQRCKLEFRCLFYLVKTKTSCYLHSITFGVLFSGD